jgi:hypothetical protein
LPHGRISIGRDRYCLKTRLSRFRFHFIVARLQNGGASRRRVAFIEYILAATGFVTFLTQIVCTRAERFGFSLVPSMLFFSVHMLTATMFIDFLQSSDSPAHAMFGSSTVGDTIESRPMEESQRSTSSRRNSHI